MVGSECPEIINLQDRHFSDLNKAGGPIELCIHLTEKGLSLQKRFGLPNSRSLLFFSMGEGGGVPCECGVWARRRKRKVASLSKNQDIKKAPK